MGNYDAIIIGHSQFERIPISDERQAAMLRSQLDDLENAIQSARYEQDGGRYTIKQIEKTRKTLQVRLEKLNKKEKKDSVVTFEELGVDHLYVDEAHSYKNAFLYTKMRNVAGIARTKHRNQQICSINVSIWMKLPVERGLLSQQVLRSATA